MEGTFSSFLSTSHFTCFSSQSIQAHNLPMYFFARLETCYRVLSKFIRLWNCPCFTLQCNRLYAPWQSIMIRPIRTCKVFQQIEFSFLIKDVCVHFHTTVCREDSGTSTARFFHVRRMWCRIGTQKEFRTATSGGSDEGLAMNFGFQNGQAIQMRSNSANQHVWS